ncbi:MAG: Asp/Glu/hydantoin racemase [Burkholderiales bacterium]
MGLRLGMVLPSSNTVVEPVAIAIAADLPGTAVHFARFALTAVNVADPAAAYYDSGAILGAARLLADARCDAICWNGSAGGLVGIARDRALVRDISAVTGIPATTSSLALLAELGRLGTHRIGLVTLNTPAMNATITRHFAAEGIEVVASTHRTDMVDNFAMAQVDPLEVADAVRTSAGRPGVQAVVVYGTNTRGASVAAPLMRELGMPVLDSVAWGVFGAIQASGTVLASQSKLQGWGAMPSGVI